jgi:hypothetical protein
MKDLIKYFRLPRDKIVEFNFILEAYEGLGIVRTIDSERGLVEVMISPDFEKDFDWFIERISPELGMTAIKKPTDAISIEDE